MKKAQALLFALIVQFVSNALRDIMGVSAHGQRCQVRRKYSAHRLLHLFFCSISCSYFGGVRGNLICAESIWLYSMEYDRCNLHRFVWCNIWRTYGVAGTAKWPIKPYFIWHRWYCTNSVELFPESPQYFTHVHPHHLRTLSTNSQYHVNILAAHLWTCRILYAGEIRLNRSGLQILKL